MLTHEELKQKAMSDPEVLKEYQEMEAEFQLFKELLHARKQAGLSQAEVAELMGTKTPAIARLESGGGSKRHSPSLTTLRKYAKAVGCHLEIKLIPDILERAHK